MIEANYETVPGDIIKSLLQNLPKDEKTAYEEPNKQLNKTQYKANFCISDAILKLKDLKGVIKGTNNKEFLSNDSINNYLIYPSVLNLSLLIQKLFSIFEAKSINEIYFILIESFNNVYTKEKNKELFLNSNDNMLKKNQLFELIQELNFFTSPSIIYVNAPLINKSSLDFFISHFLSDNKITKNIMKSFINIFNIKHLIFDYFIWNKEKIIKGNIYVPKLLSLISILNLEENFSYQLIFFHKKNIFFEQDSFVYDLYCTYNKSIKQIKELTDYLISMKRNWVSVLVIEKIMYDKFICERIDNHIKKMIIMNLMDNNLRPYLIDEKNNFTLSANKDRKASLKLISYYHILSDNKNCMNFDFASEIKELNSFFNELINNKDYDKCIKLINCLDNKFISHIKKESFHTLIKELPFSKIEQIKSALKLFPEEIKYILIELEKKNNFKEGIKLIKLLNLEWKEYDKAWDRYSIRTFYNYKIKECLDDKFDILLDYALISETLYNELINKLLNKIKKTKSETKKEREKENFNDMNINSNLKVIEFEYPENNSIFSTNKQKKDNFFNNNAFNDKKNIIQGFDIFNKTENINDFSYEFNFQKTDSDDDECRIILNNFKNISDNKLKEKTALLFKLGRDKNYMLTKANKSLFDIIFNYKLPKININNYIFEDKFSPHDSSCYQIDLKNVQVYFVDSIQKLYEQFSKYFQNTKIIGIDSEWKQQFYARNKEFCSIIQMANYEERNVIILDMIKLIKEKEFTELFRKFFGDKTFVGYSFDSSDLDHFSNGIQNTFKKAEIIDLIDLYQCKYLVKAQGLKNMSKEILGINLCKYEQCSFWENRPLKQSQLHYAAVDALICVSLYKKLINNTKIN